MTYALQPRGAARRLYPSRKPPRTRFLLVSNTTALSSGALLIFLLTAACQPQMERSGIGQNYGDMRERQLRAVQMQGVESGSNPGVQNAPVTAVNPGTTGIERAPAGGAGSSTAGAPAAVNPGTTGIVRQPGVGAPMR